MKLFLGVITCAKKEEEVLGDVTTSVRNVAMDLLDKATSTTNGNSVISPISIAGAMFMTAACTKAKKAAEIEILETFYNDLEKSNVDAYALVLNLYYLSLVSMKQWVIE